MDHNVCFQSINDRRDVLTFPCDADGRADMDAMDTVTRDRYLYRRALVGIVYSMVHLRRPCITTSDVR